MVWLKKLRKWVEAINTYYGFALLAYAAALYIAGHTYIFFWIFIVTTPFIAGWTGYLLKSTLERRNQRHGFRVISDIVSYEIGAHRKYISRSSTKIQACTDHLMVYPLGYQWTGSGEEAIPKVTSPGQQLLAQFEPSNDKDSRFKISPYKVTPTEGEWRYWFISLNPPVHQGEIVEIDYSQEFYDKKSLAKPYLRYFVKIPLKRLELNVKFPENALPTTVKTSYTKPSDPNRPYTKTDALHYDPDRQWVTWVINKPKRGYCYRIYWQ